jgi:hypothetical protein
MKTLFVTLYNTKRTYTRTCCCCGILEYILDDGILLEESELCNEEVCSLCIDKDADYEKEEDLKELIQRAENSGTMLFHSSTIQCKIILPGALVI